MLHSYVDQVSNFPSVLNAPAYTNLCSCPPMHQLKRMPNIYLLYWWQILFFTSLVGSYHPIINNLQVGSDEKLWIRLLVLLFAQIIFLLYCLNYIKSMNPHVRQSCTTICLFSSNFVFDISISQRGTEQASDGNREKKICLIAIYII